MYLVFYKTKDMTVKCKYAALLWKMVFQQNLVNIYLPPCMLTFLHPTICCHHGSKHIDTELWGGTSITKYIIMCGSGHQVMIWKLLVRCKAEWQWQSLPLAAVERQ